MPGHAIDQIITTAKGRSVGCLDRGPRDGRCVIYLHGQPGSRLEALLLPDEILIRHDIRLIALDRPGYGETDAQAGDRLARTTDVLDACDELGVPSFTLLANSAGGSYAVVLAATAPDRVDRLVLSSAQMPYEDGAPLQQLQFGQSTLLAALRGGRTDALTKGIEAFRVSLLNDPLSAMSASLDTLTDREQRWLAQPAIRELLIADMREGLRLRADGFLDDLLLWPQPFEVDPSLVRCPVRAIHGTVDDWEPLDNLRRVLRRMPDSQLILLDGLNHLGPLLHPDVVLSLTENHLRPS